MASWIKEPRTCLYVCNAAPSSTSVNHGLSIYLLVLFGKEKNKQPPIYGALLAMSFLTTSLIACIIFAVYYQTTPEGVAGGDRFLFSLRFSMHFSFLPFSGELLAEGCQLGTAHPPGYPTYTLLIHLIKWLFNPDSAFLFNLSSAWLTAGCLFFLGLSTHDIARSMLFRLGYARMGVVALVGAAYAMVSSA